MIRVGEQLPDGLTRDVRSLRWSVMVKLPPTPPKIEKNKFVLKCFLGNFKCFQPMFFLVENWPILTPSPPLLVENSTNFFLFLKPSLIVGKRKKGRKVGQKILLRMQRKKETACARCLHIQRRKLLDVNSSTCISQLNGMRQILWNVRAAVRTPKLA